MTAIVYTRARHRRAALGSGKTMLTLAHARFRNAASPLQVPNAGRIISTPLSTRRRPANKVLIRQLGDDPAQLGELGVAAGDTCELILCEV